MAGYDVANASARQLVVVAALEKNDLEWRTSLDELERLADTAHGQVVAVVTQKREMPNPKTFLGKGKVEEVGEIMERGDASLLIIDGEISPSQQRNLEKVLERQVIDRTGLILDIFARRAQTSEGQLQVELAQLKYLLPRLTNLWTHLDTSQGGIGSRGPGESQIETDRRLVRNRIDMLGEKVEEIRRRRRIQRSQRKQSQIPLVSLVGYTNSGKSTLLNVLSGAGVFVEDKLFATLDPTTRDVIMPNGTRVLLSDTVGFIRNLPTQLVAAFRATLEEVSSADILVHVVDASFDGWMEQVETVERVLTELEVGTKPVVMAFNKLDAVDDVQMLHTLAARFPNVVFLSARKGTGLAELEAEIVRVVRSNWETLTVTLPHSAGDLVAEAHGRGEVLTEDYEGMTVVLHARVPADLAARLHMRAGKR